MQGNQPGVLMHPVMVISAVIVLLLAGVGALMPAEFERLAKNLLLFTTTNFGWFYLLTVFAIVIFLFGLAVSRFGSIRLGPEGSRPEFPFFT